MESFGVSPLVLLIVCGGPLLLLVVGAMVVVGVRNRRASADYQPTLPSGPQPDAQPQLGGAVEAEVRALVARNQKIEAIKLVRQRTGLGLKEAKDYVERLAK